MRTYALKRLAIALPTLIGAYALIFLLTRLVPGDPALMIVEENFSQANYETVRQQLGLDLPLFRQLSRAAWSALQGDLGDSFRTGRTVVASIADQIPHTLRLAGAALLVAVSVGIPVGIVAAVYRNRWPDHVVMGVALLVLCAPNFWLGVVFILVFSLYLDWLPSFGTGFSNDPWVVLQHLILPSIVLGLSGAGILARMVRSSMLEVLSLDYVRTARAMGFHPRTVVFRYALRNALVVIVTVVGLEAVKLITGTVVIETVFARPGVGRTLIESILARDYPVTQAVLLLFVTLSIAINLVTDLSYALINPRMRYE